jgi:hypothetical protein
MSVTLTGVITGSAQTGLTSPTYTNVADVAPDVNGKASSVSTIGGTQTGVRVHTVSDPFAVLFVRPKVLKPLPQVNPVTGKYPPIPANRYLLKTTKGVLPAANVASTPLYITTTIECPAGADSYDIANVRAALSCHIGELTSNSAGLGDTLNTGVM